MEGAKAIEVARNVLVVFGGVLAAMRGFLASCEGSMECGKVCASGMYEKGTVKGTKFMSAARKLGMKVK